MNKIYWVILVAFIISCTAEDKNFVTLKGTLKKAGVEKITVQGRGFSKEISVNSNGIFLDTLIVTDGVHAIQNGNDRITLFLKNGYDLNLDFKGEKLADGISFSGIGAETNNFMEDKRSFYMSEYANPKAYFSLNKEDYLAKISEAKSLLQSYKDKTPNLDSIIYSMDVRNDSLFFGYIQSNYEKMHENAERLGKGKVSPKFTNYENFNGGTTTLDEFIGTYVYIDIWATWCAPCKVEIPYLNALEKEFHGKNITFVSISVDKPGAYELWKRMVKEGELAGVQLFADNNFESDFIVAYGIKAIPRYILIDPEGKIVDANAVRPSNPKLKELFEELGI